MDKRYKAKVNHMYVRKASEFWHEIALSPRSKDANYLSEKDKGFLLKYFPNAEIRSYSIVEDEGF